jgi:hypothetical protein
MPYRQVWEPAPKDFTVEVLPELPEGYKELNGIAAGFYKEAVNRKDIFDNFYYCKRCGGWIKGKPNSYKVDTLAPLSGRRGTEYYCRRCGEEIGFTGVMS